jgi:hypothetical protein
LLLAFSAIPVPVRHHAGALRFALNSKKAAISELLLV